MLEILNHLVSETEPFGFDKFALVEQIFSLCIGQKPDHPI
jgi:hypothetical protein